MSNYDIMVQIHDIIYDIMKTMISYDNIMYMKHEAPGFLVPLISAQNTWYHIWYHSKLWYHKM